MIEKTEDASIITIYFGEDIEEKQALKLKEYISEKYDYLDIEIIYGGQPLYYYVISVE